MAYFSNGSEGMCFDDQCAKCKYGLLPCPIALVQIMYNYDAANNEVATKILDSLVSDNGTCSMFEEFKSDVAIDPNQTTLPLDVEVMPDWKALKLKFMERSPVIEYRICKCENRSSYWRDKEDNTICSDCNLPVPLN